MADDRYTYSNRDNKYNGNNTVHIAGGLEAFEAARSGFFALIIDASQLNNLPKPTYTSTDLDAVPTDADLYKAEDYQEVLKLAVTKCDVPSYEVTTFEYRRGNDVVKFAGIPTFKGGSLTVDDYIGIDTKSMLYAWLRLAYDPFTRKGGRMKDYKKNCTLVEYTQDYQVVRQWKLEGCFITSIGEDAFNRESDGKRQMTVDFSYDRAEMIIDKEINPNS